MRLRWLVPFIGWRVLSLSDQLQMGLDYMWVWQSFEVEWFGHGVCIWVKAKHRRDWS